MTWTRHLRKRPRGRLWRQRLPWRHQMQAMKSVASLSGWVDSQHLWKRGENSWRSSFVQYLWGWLLVSAGGWPWYPGASGHRSFQNVLWNRTPRCWRTRHLRCRCWCRWRGSRRRRHLQHPAAVALSSRPGAATGCACGRLTWRMVRVLVWQLRQLQRVQQARHPRALQNHLHSIHTVRHRHSTSVNKSRLASL